MKKIKKYCDSCLKNVNCEYFEKNKNETIEGITIEYLEKYYKCSECGNKFYDDLLDYNVLIANEKLREKSGLITIPEIEQILNKYCIGKKPLSLVLELGEITITRYLNGQNPTREISNLLKNILYNPLLFEMFLIANKDKISKVAYRKSMGKTKQEELVSSKSKLYNVSLYILQKEKEIDTLSLQKLLYFISGFSKAFSDVKNLILDSSESWIHGTVYREIYDAFAYYGYNKIDYNELVKDRDFYLSDEEKTFIDAIIDAFGFYSGSILREMTHMTDPWIESRKGLKEDDFSNRIIDNDSIEKYFKRICEEYKIDDYKKIKKYSDAMFEESKKRLLH